MKGTRRRKRRISKEAKQIMIRLFYVFVVFALIGFNTYIATERRAAYDYNDVEIWIVSEGETLWGIAQRHSNDSHDVRKVIDIIQDINGDITSNIRPGQAIDVPLFKNMDWEYYEGEN